MPKSETGVHSVAGSVAFSRRSLLVATGGIIGSSLLSGCSGGKDRVASVAANLRRPLELNAVDPLPELVRFATLAANSHNTQPWTFARVGTGLRISPDLKRRTPAVDPDDHHLFASLGCAAENLIQAAGAFGLGSAYRFDAEGGFLETDLVAANAKASSLVSAIPKRQCTRSVYDGRPVSTADLRRLEQAAATEGVDVALITDRAALNRIRDAVIAGNAAQIRDKAFFDELRAWIRFDAQSALANADGLFVAASGNPVVPGWLGRSIFPMVFTVDGESEKYAEQMASSAGVAVFVGAGNDPAHWTMAGRAYQRFALQATSMGIKHAFINQPVEVQSLRAAFAETVGFPGRRVDLVVRFGTAPHLPFSLRRPVAEVFSG
jgi:hypothetical protein